MCLKRLRTTAFESSVPLFLLRRVGASLLTLYVGMNIDL